MSCLPSGSARRAALIDSAVTSPSISIREYTSDSIDLSRLRISKSSVASSRAAAV